MATENLNLDELDYEDEPIDEVVNSRISPQATPTHSDGELSDDDGEVKSSDDGEIKSDSEDGEIKGSDSEGEVYDLTEEPSIFPKKKKVKDRITDPAPVERERPLCRYYKQGYCQYGTRCHFLHSRPNMVNYNPENQEKVDTGNYTLFKPEEAAKVTRKITPILPPKSVHLGHHRPPPPKPTGETSWEKGLQQAREARKRREMIKRGEIPPPPIERLEVTDESKSLVAANAYSKVRIERVPSKSPESLIQDNKSKSKSKKGSKTENWHTSINYMEEKRSISRGTKRPRKPHEGSSDSDSSSSSSSSSSAESTETISSESSGRKTPKGYRRSGTAPRRSSSEDEDYRRTKRLEAKAKGISTKKKKENGHRSSSTTKKKSNKRARHRSSSSSSTGSAESDESSGSAHSSKSEKKKMKLQKQLKQVEAALKAKRVKNKRK